CRGNVWRCGCGVVIRGLPQVLAINQRIITTPVTDLSDHISQIGVDALARKQALIQLPLHLFCQLRPIPPYNLHADELNVAGDFRTAAVEQPGVALASSPRAMSRMG